MFFEGKNGVGCCLHKFVLSSLSSKSTIQRCSTWNNERCRFCFQRRCEETSFEFPGQPDLGWASTADVHVASNLLEGWLLYFPWLLGWAFGSIQKHFIQGWTFNICVDVQGYLLATSRNISQWWIFNICVDVQGWASGDIHKHFTGVDI